MMLYRLSLAQARALGVLPNPANDVLRLIVGGAEPTPTGSRSLLCTTHSMSEIKSDQMGMGCGATDTEVLAAVAKMLEARIPAMGNEGLAQLEAECSAEKRSRLATNPQHQAGSTERWAWHAGYVSAMNDALNIIKNRPAQWPMADDHGTPDY